MEFRKSEAQKASNPTPNLQLSSSRSINYKRPTCTWEEQQIQIHIDRFKTLQGDEQTPVLRGSSVGPTGILSGAFLHSFGTARTPSHTQKSGHRGATPAPNLTFLKSSSTHRA